MTTALLASSLAGAASSPAIRSAATRFLDVPGGRLAYEEIGSGPLVVMVPGMGDVRQEYRFLAPQLATAGFRAVSADLRGHGGSSTGWAAYTPEAVAADIAALVRHLGGPAVIVGNSMAAGSAAHVAALAPELVQRLVLLGPAVRDVRPASRLKALGQALLIRFAFSGPWAVSAWKTFYRSLYPTRPPADLPAYIDALAANLHQPGRMAALKAMIRAPKDGIEARLGDAHVPTLVVMGTRDPDFPDPAAEAQWVAARLAGEVVLVDGAGHYPHAEMPEITGPAVLRFLGAA
jgi:pimeloyl-ACP methyl ester carboxylesterase